ncbi:MAG TPA: hypothetical protein VFJ83_01350, partial [Nocardioidaceae bacterium]|nr:hypothetical protein [Nocardioidaceae bacterium]
ARADLHGGARLGDRGKEPQRGSTAGADRHDADLLGAAARGSKYLVLAYEVLGVSPARGLESRSDDGLLGRQNGICGCSGSFRA